MSETQGNERKSNFKRRATIAAGIAATAVAAGAGINAIVESSNQSQDKPQASGIVEPSSLPPSMGTSVKSPDGSLTVNFPPETINPMQSSPEPTGSLVPPVARTPEPTPVHTQKPTSMPSPEPTGSLVPPVSRTPEPTPTLSPEPTGSLVPPVSRTPEPTPTLSPEPTGSLVPPVSRTPEPTPTLSPDPNK